MVDAAMESLPEAREATRPMRSPVTEARWVRNLLIASVVVLLAIFVLMPLIAVFVQALSLGLGAALATFNDPDAIAAIGLTLLVAAIAVPLNVLFGIAAAWAIAKHRFRGRSLLISLIDLPFSVSPVVAGLVYVLLLGPFTPIGAWLLEDYGIRVIFAVPGVVLATVFVTFPFVARELIPLMQDQGTGDEEAALSLGASGWQTFWRVTLPNVKWALLYGVLLCNARAMGEFGAVAVISGKLRGETVTMPLQIELYYQEFRALAQVSAFSLAAVLAGLALVTLAVKSWLEWRYADQLAGSRGH
ncbi:sulfate ABC transporter permease subunit CysW [Aurantimonas endophytica]|uniref:Sulfate transport system permease protein n=1 Tax=Aurantimonas endophytica TaxID=1522175 RepID=A0A7W6HC00_9HYPH|nr:sulfate ABC transporter permease subunit CysW [Aurantimonas endophytica]MBB4002158.1 sulfate transport system permease protein [Aurantimonas endophytica]MCO6402213.1 sulfate ABC transporter permease subunit CysW [Aurantimonas endophytica]